jgi:hypothetical protein
MEVAMGKRGLMHIMILGAVPSRTSQPIAGLEENKDVLFRVI